MARRIGVMEKIKRDFHRSFGSTAARSLKVYVITCSFTTSLLPSPTIAEGLAVPLPSRCFFPFNIPPNHTNSQTNFNLYDLRPSSSQFILPIPIPSLTSPRVLFNMKISVLAVMAALAPLLSSAAIVNVCRSCQKLDEHVN